MSLEKIRDTTYHAENFLRDRLVPSSYIQSIQKNLQDRITGTLQEAVNIIGNHKCEN